MALLPACHVWVFLDCHHRNLAMGNTDGRIKRIVQEKKVGLVRQNLGKHRLRAWDGEEVSWFYGGPNLISNYEQSLRCHGGQLKLNKYSVNVVCLLVSLKREHRPIEEVGKHSFWHRRPSCPSVKSLTHPGHCLHRDTLFFRLQRKIGVVEHISRTQGPHLFSLRKHLSKQQQSQGQVSPVSVSDSSQQKFSRDGS